MESEAAVAFGPRLAALSRLADTLDASFRRYLAGCYRQVTRSTTAGVSSGSGAAYSVGAAVSNEGFVSWEAGSAYAWQEAWTAESAIDNECRAARGARTAHTSMIL
jgi:hypothetical protein